MGKPIVDLRVGVRSAQGLESSIWRLIGTKRGDVYFAIRSLAGVTKYSFHRSGICRSAFTTEHGTPPKLPDRLMFKWKRAPISPAGKGRLSRVLLLAVPTDFLSAPRLCVPGVLWLEAAPSGAATYFSIAFTAEPHAEVTLAYRRNGIRNIQYAEMDGGINLLVDYYHSDWLNEDLRMPGEGKVNDLLFSANDPAGTGRPIRLTFSPTPKDGDALHVRELGGYAVEAGR